MSPQSSIAHYRITSKLGEGGMGAVYRATDTKLGRDVAIKVIPEAFAQDPDRLARFTREAQVLASLNHPNIAAIYGVEERALVMELVPGPTLAERIAQGPIPLPEALPIARQIAEALEYAHEKGVIHRDLKPANIKVTPEGQVKVLDFGLAKALASEPATTDPAASPTLTMRATLAGVILGTAAYMSPEQARGAPTDKRADIWSFGVLLYEMLIGRQTFSGDTVSDILAAVLKTEPDWSALPPETQPAIRRLLRRSIERDRKRRLSDMADARLEIDEALTAPAEPAPAAQLPARASSRWPAALAVLFAIVALGLAAIHFREQPPEAAAVRFQIPAPEKATLLGIRSGFGLAVSPDGRHLAFTAVGENGVPMIWVRTLDSLDSRPLPGTEGVTNTLFWSPDSRFLGFGTQGSLKKVEISGGPAQTLCSTPVARIAGGTWNQDGVILFGGLRAGLFQVSQGGGAAKPLTAPDSSQGEIGHLSPYFLPDGRRFLYVSAVSPQENSVIYLATLDGKERTRLLSGSFPVYAPGFGNEKRGHVLFARQNTLMALPLDPASFRPAGEARPVSEHRVLAQTRLSVSANGVLAYRAATGADVSQLMWFDRQGKPLGAVGPPGDYIDLALSPDGKRVAVNRGDPQSSDRDIWLIDVATGVPTKFTFDPPEDWDLVWSPDGSRLAYSSAKPGSAGLQMYEKNSNGSASEILLLKFPGGARPKDWSRNGRFLLFVSVDPKTGADLWILPLEGGRKPIPYLQTPFNESHAQFSPDGRWIAYSSDESGPGRQIYVQSFPLGSGKFQISSTGGVQPRWSSDGKELFYLASDGKLMAVEVKTAPGFEKQPPTPLFETRMAAPFSGVVFYYDISPDGKRFLIKTAGQADEAASPPITVVLNWTAGLKR